MYPQIEVTKKKKLIASEGPRYFRRSFGGTERSRGLAFWSRDAHENRQKRAIFNGFRTIGERPFRFRNSLARSCQYNCHYVACGDGKMVGGRSSMARFYRRSTPGGYRGREARPFAAAKLFSSPEKKRVCGRVAVAFFGVGYQGARGEEKWQLFAEGNRGELTRNRTSPGRLHADDSNRWFCLSARLNVAQCSLMVTRIFRDFIAPCSVSGYFI